MMDGLPTSEAHVDDEKAAISGISYSAGQTVERLHLHPPTDWIQVALATNVKGVLILTGRDWAAIAICLVIMVACLVLLWLEPRFLFGPH